MDNQSVARYTRAAAPPAGRIIAVSKRVNDLGITDLS